MSGDRLAEIKDRHVDGYRSPATEREDKAWLVAEVERLRAEVELQTSYKEAHRLACIETYKEVERLAMRCGTDDRLRPRT